MYRHKVYLPYVLSCKIKIKINRTIEKVIKQLLEKKNLTVIKFIVNSRIFPEPGKA